MTTVLIVFGTRPEAIKLAPVVWALQQANERWRCVTVCSSQHEELLRPLTGLLRLPVHHDLHCMRNSQTPADVLALVLQRLKPIIEAERPAAIVVQGDTSTALAGALAGFYAGVPVVHVEAGLRTGNIASPFPEEMHRRQISLLADLHLAATAGNQAELLREGCAPQQVRVTGNTVVDALLWMRQNAQPSAALQTLLQRLAGQRLLVLTTHRRENFGAVMKGHLGAVRDFVQRHPDVHLVFPVHPNPQVVSLAHEVLGGQPRVHLIEPLHYSDFVHLLAAAWLVCSDSGGIQEEAPTLQKPVLILRDTTERAEVLDCGVGKLAGHCPDRLRLLLQQAYDDPSWQRTAQQATNPFGAGDAGQRILAALDERYGAKAVAEVQA